MANLYSSIQCFQYGSVLHHHLDWRRYRLPPRSKLVKNSIIHSRALYSRLEQCALLGRHHGCVNTLHWSFDGSLLASGSDEGRCCLWYYSEQQGNHLAASWDTGHTQNIFSAKFFPFSTTKLATCSGDSEIRLFDTTRATNIVDTKNDKEMQPTTIYRCHNDRTKKLCMLSPEVFLSVSEDGTVRKFDTREKHDCSGHDCDSHVMYDGDTSLWSISLHPQNRVEYLVAGASSNVLKCDLRKPKSGICNYRPGGDRAVRAMNHATAVDYNYNGEEFIANYSQLGVYRFDSGPGKMSTTGASCADKKMKDKDEDEDEGGKLPIYTEYMSVYQGAINVRTIKGVTYLGSRSEYVSSGSDLGNFHIWALDGTLVNVLKADTYVVNCVAGHPSECKIAVSGIDSTVKLFSPIAATAATPLKVAKVLEERPEHSSENIFGRFPIAWLLRMLEAGVDSNDDNDDDDDDSNDNDDDDDDSDIDDNDENGNENEGEQGEDDRMMDGE